MAVGYLSMGKCWPTQMKALDAYYSSVQPQMQTQFVQGVHTASTQHDIVTAFPRKASGAWAIEYKSCSFPSGSLVCKTTNVTAPTFMIKTCDTNDFISTSTGDGGSSTPIPMGLPEGFDYTILGAIFAFSFSIVVGLWLFGKSAGSIVNIFKPK